MSIEEILKLDRKLGEYYCLIPLPNDNWTLGRTGSQREIMNSEKNTKEQLLEFVKEHKKHNITKAISTTCLVINALWLLLIIANFFIKSTVLMCMSWGVLLTLLPVLIVLDVVMSNNRKVMNKVAEEDVKYLNELQSKRIIDNIIQHQKMEAKTKSKTKKDKVYTVKMKGSNLSTGETKNTTTTRAKVKNSTLTTGRKPRTKGEDKKEV